MKTRKRPAALTAALFMILIWTIPAEAGQHTIGYLDCMDGLTVCGWAWDPDSPDSAVDVQITVRNTEDNSLLCTQTCSAGMYREDLAHIGNGFHAFAADLDLPSLSSGSYLIEASSQGIPLDGTLYWLGNAFPIQTAKPDPPEIPYGPLGHLYESKNELATVAFSTDNAVTAAFSSDNAATAAFSSDNAAADISADIAAAAASTDIDAADISTDNVMAAASTDNVAAAASPAVPEDILALHLTSLGTFRTTAYCSCRSCSGRWGSLTSTGSVAVSNHTVAVDPKVIPYGTKLMIDGVVYTAEDEGSGVKGRHIDIYCGTHAAAAAYGMQNKEVFLVP